MTSIFDIEDEAQEQIPDSQATSEPIEGPKKLSLTGRKPAYGGNIARAATRAAGGLYDFATLPYRAGQYTGSLLGNMIGVDTTETPEIADPNILEKGLELGASLSRAGGEDLVELYDTLTGGAYEPTTPEGRIAEEALSRGLEFGATGGLMGFGPALSEILGGGALGAAWGAGSKGLQEAGVGPLTAELATGAALHPKQSLKLIKSPAKLTGAIKRGFQKAKNIVGFNPERDLARTPLFYREISKAAESDIKLSGKQLNQRIARFNEEEVAPIKYKFETLSEPLGTDFALHDMQAIQSEILEDQTNQWLNEIYPVASESPYGRGDTAQAIRDISQKVTKEYENIDDAFREQYGAVNQYTRHIRYKPQSTVKEARELARELQKSPFNFAPDSELGRIVEEVLDGLLEYVPPVRNKQGIKRGGYYRTKEISVENAIEGARSLNRLQNYDQLTPDIKNRARVLSKKLKDSAVARMPKEIANEYRRIDEAYGYAQQVYNSNFMQQLRKAEQFGFVPESVAQQMFTPSNMQKLREAAGAYSQEYKLAERLFAEHLSKQSPRRGKELLRDVKPYISDRAATRMEAIVQSPLTKEGRQAQDRATILKDLTAMVETGDRPSFTLKKRRTPEGRKQVQSVLEKSPAGKQLQEALDRIELGDIGKTIFKPTPDGGIALDQVALTEMLKNPEQRRIVKDLMGEKGLLQLQNIQKYQDNFAKNMARYQAKDPGFMDLLIKKMEHKPYLIPGIALGLGFPKAAMLAVASGATRLAVERNAMIRAIQEAEQAYSGATLIQPLATKKGQKIMDQLASPNTPAWKAIELLERLGLIMTESGEPPDY